MNSSSDIQTIEDDIDIRDDLTIEAGIALDRARRKMHEAAFELQMDRWMRKTVARVSGLLEYEFGEFGIEEKDIASYITDKLLPVIACVNNPNQRPITECVHAWLYKSAHRYCLNCVRHLKVVEKHEQAIAHEQTIGRINSVAILKSAGLNPEEQLLQKRAEEEWESRKTEMRIRVRRVITSFPPAHQNIAVLWTQGWDPKAISTRTGAGLATVYRKLGEVQKAVLKETGVEGLGLEDTAENKSFIKTALKQLVANSLQGL